MTVQESERVGTDPITDLMKFMQDSWENFVIQNNLLVAVGSDALFDYFCKMFCEIMRPQIQQIIRAYTSEIERKRRSQST
jgi:hypothetical protein